MSFYVGGDSPWGVAHYVRRQEAELLWSVAGGGSEGYVADASWAKATFSAGALALAKKWRANYLYWDGIEDNNVISWEWYAVLGREQISGAELKTPKIMDYLESSLRTYHPRYWLKAQALLAQEMQAVMI